MREGEALTLREREGLRQQAWRFSGVPADWLVGEETDIAKLVEPLVSPAGGGVGQEPKFAGSVDQRLDRDAPD